MKLVEFHIRHPTARSPCHGNAVAGRTVRVARVQVDLACTTSGQNNEPRLKYLHTPSGSIQHIGARAAAMVPTQRGQVDQVNRNAIVKELDIAVIQYLIREGLCNGFSRRVSDMNYPAEGVPTLTS